MIDGDFKELKAVEVASCPVIDGRTISDADRWTMFDSCHCPHITRCCSGTPVTAKYILPDGTDEVVTSGRLMALRSPSASDENAYLAQPHPQACTSLPYEFRF